MGGCRGMVDFTRLRRPELEAMAAAGYDLLECRRVLAKTGDSVVSELRRGAAEFVEWAHYPAGGVSAPEPQAQFFSPAHPPAERSAGEHGHFHTFLRPRGMPPGTRPLILPELGIADAPAAPAGAAVPPMRSCPGAAGIAARCMSSRIADSTWPRPWISMSTTSSAGSPWR